MKKTSEPDRRVLDLVKGSTEPPNSFIRYQVDQLKASIAESQMIFQKIEKLNHELEEAKNRAIQLDGIAMQYEIDIVHHLDSNDGKKGEK